MPSVDPLTTLPKTRTAVVAESAGKLVIKHDLPIPPLAADTVLVKVAAVAINPSDAKFLDYSPAPGAVHGTDYAGTIVALGSDPSVLHGLMVGDRVAGMVHGMNKLIPEIGAFGEYIVATAHTLLKIPDSMRFEDAATLGLATGTAAFGLFSMLRVPATLEQLANGGVNAKGSDFVLVAGGSTATGARAIQLLKAAGLRPIATASPSKFGLVRGFGAEKVFDYHSETCGAGIREYTGNELAYAFDCVAEAETTELCYQSLGRAGGRYVTVEPFRESVVKTREFTVEPSWLMATSIFGNKIALEGAFARDAVPEYKVFGGKAFAAAQSLLDHGLIEPHPTKSMPGGWEGVLDGVNIIRGQPPSGYKLVYSV
ncbi:GroES-like protein [Xylaria bambusicola]|uniref:GroES-like protein n=1 Tax=Xylaria bambusicola TaxID=326684 RepID=UPI002008C6F6|nr:GroES-like protein [Xylaria bambusicola]KAI0518348.1 GroES-like protein [Xylaria bambusicola]